jgi:hypothetical protein
VIGNDTTGQQRLMELDDSIQLRRHPYPPYNDDKFVLVIQQQFPLILILSFVLVALNVVKDVVHEKERKLKVKVVHGFCVIQVMHIVVHNGILRPQVYVEVVEKSVDALKSKIDPYILCTITKCLYYMYHKTAGSF